jgi:GNAT superfamily N-acetyltransferase
VRSIDNALVLLQCSLDDLAPARLDHLGDTRPMNMLDDGDVRTWLDIHNDAYGRSWDRAQYEAWILHHPHVDVLHTYLLYQDARPVGAGSAALFRRNRTIGVGHYVGVRKAYQGRGFGSRLMLFRYHRLRELGVASFEMETTISRRRSLWAHFNCGFKPKPRFDDWNTYDQAAPWIRALTRVRLERLYQQWRRR